MEIIKTLQSFSNPILDIIFTFITMLGEHTFMILAITIVFWCINKNIGYKLGFSILSGSMLNNFIKNIFHTKRPIGRKGIRSLRTNTAVGYSFPSGHTQSTASFWTIISHEAKKVWICIFSILLVILVGISRLYLGVHWPIDVIFGAIIGTLWALICCIIFDFSNKNKPFIFTLLIPGLLSLLIYGGKDTANSLAVLLGFIAGYILENKYINFNPRTSLLNQFVKYFLGISVAFIFENLFKFLLPNYFICSFIKYFIIGLWITAGAPFIFKKFFRRTY